MKRSRHLISGNNRHVPERWLESWIFLKIARDIGSPRFEVAPVVDFLEQLGLDCIPVI